MLLLVGSIFVSIHNLRSTIKLNIKIEESNNQLLKIYKSLTKQEFFQHFYDLMNGSFIKVKKKDFQGHNHGDDPCTANKNVKVYIYDYSICVKKYGDVI